MTQNDVYHDWQQRAQQAQRLAADPNLPLWEKTHRVGAVYAGVELQGLKKKHRHHVLSTLSAVNEILAQYTLHTFDDYQQIADQDLQTLLDLFCSLTFPPK